MRTNRLLWMVTAVAVACLGASPSIAQAVTPGCVTPPAGVVAWWPLDEQTGVTAKDIVGNNNGAYVNVPVPLLGAYVDNSLCFNGSNYVDVPSAAALNVGTGDFSIDAWVKRDLTSTNTPPSVIVDKRDPPVGSDIGYSLAVSYGRLVFRMNNTNYATLTSPVPADGLWHFVAVTVHRASNGGQFYCDGIPLDVFSPHGGDLNNANFFRIGAGELSGNQPWRGCIDELELYNRALTLSELNSIWGAGNLGKCKCAMPPPNMVAWWPLDEQVGATIVKDIIGGHNGAPSPGPIGPILNPSGPTPASLWPPASGGKVGDALYFWSQAQNRYVRVPGAPFQFGTTDFSIDAWVFITQYNPTNIQPIVEKMQYNGTTPSLGYRLYLESGVLTFQVAVSGITATAQVGMPNQLSLGVWHHVAIAYNRQSPSFQFVTFYIDGVPLMSGLMANVGDLSNSSDVIIGGSILGPAINYLDIGIDELEIFARMLDPSEVYSIWNADRVGKCCDCPHQGDLDGNGFIDVQDVLAVIYIAFLNAPDVQDPLCPKTRANVNNDGVVDVNDVLYIIYTAFLNGPPPIDPCNP